MDFIKDSLFPGVLASIIAAIFLIWWQFRSSTAGYRVRMVRKATTAITTPNVNTSTLRDKYRYSLGVIIDDLHQSFTQGFKENGPWPALVDRSEECVPQTNAELKDRWHKFDLYIRPVIEDINAYSFIGFLQLTPDLRHLHSLTNLCHRLEDVVGELDAAFEERLVCLENNRVIVQKGKESQINDLRRSYKELYNTWRTWYGKPINSV